MSFKTIFIVIVTVLVTIVLMNNSEEIDFWFFGDTRVPKLIAMGSMFIIGLISGLLLRRTKTTQQEIGNYPDDSFDDEPKDRLSDEDRDYIR